MNRAILLKTVREVYLLLAGCFAVVFAFCWIRVWVVSQMEMGRFATVVKQLWDQFESFMPVGLEQFLTFPGRIAIGWDEPIVVFTVAIFAVVRGSDVVSGELGRGTLEMLLSQPVSRWQIVAAGTWFGTYAGVLTNQAKVERMRTLGDDLPILKKLSVDMGNPFAAPKIERVPMSSQVEMRLYIPSSFNLFCLGFFLAGLSTWFSSFDRYRWRTLGLTVAFFVLSIVSKVVGVALIKSESAWWAMFSRIRWLSIFTAYEPQKLVEYGMRRENFVWKFVEWNGPWWAPSHVEFGPGAWYAVLIGFGLIFYAAAIATFNRRDLPAPL
jgi:ABC-2 type transport system permease protein